MKKALVLLTFVCLLKGLQAQKNFQQAPIQLKRISEPIVLDGKLDEQTWFEGQPAKNFWQYFPKDSVRNDVDTEIYMAYDDKRLYIGAICHSVGNDYIVPSLRRDYRAGGSDNLTFLIDPFLDRTNAFVFGMNPLGVNREALVSNGGRDPGDDWDDSWDNKWQGESYIGDGYWSCELAIPFSTLRFKEGENRWNFNSYRFDTQSNTRSSWNRIPQNQIITSLAFMENMVWEEPLQKPGKNISIIPYITGGYDQNFEEKEDPEYNFNVGGDAKVAITPGLNLDLTFNPDFSQVEVDRQVINLDRFEVFFPERRQFFLENADLFGRFGDSRINPFFSRRIGSAKVYDEEGEEVIISNSIHYGARLSGKLDNNWRIGLLNMQTVSDGEYDLPSYNFTVAALQRKLFSRSNVGLIMVNKQALGNTDSSDLYNPFDRVVGLDYNIASSDNKWLGKVFYQQALTAEDKEQQWAHGAQLEYRIRKFSFQWEHQYVGENFQPEVGFVPRTDFFRISPQARLFFYPSGKITEHGPGLQTTMIWQPGFGKSDHRMELFYNLSFRNTSRLRFTLQHQYTHLFDPFDPTRTDSQELAENTDYNYFSFRAFYNSDGRKPFNFRFEPQIGQFFNGFRATLRGSFNYRYQPFGEIALSYNYSYIDLPEPYATTSLILVGPRIDFTFSKSIFLTAFIQYNSQAENLNINTRFQWRFAPVSDFFLVYTDNFGAYDDNGIDRFGARNRGIVAKLTYWLNL